MSFRHLLKRDLVLCTEPAGSLWHHLYRETWTAPDGTAHPGTALGCGATGTRFADAAKMPRFRIWYGASRFSAAFLETVVRDRGEGLVRDIPISADEILSRNHALVAVQSALDLVDLTEDGCTRMHIDTDCAGARSHRKGRALSAILFEHLQSPDGIRYRSRLDGSTNIAVYDRALPKLIESAVQPLTAHPELPDLIDRLRLRIRRP
jgi:hypothetical protein